MGLFRQESAYERRKRELDEEAERVRKNLQALMKTVKQDLDRPVASRPSSYQNKPEANAESTGGHVLVEIDDLEEGVPADENAAAVTDDPAPEKETLPPYGTARLRHYQNKQKENLPNYLATGSFGKRGPLTREKKIQRNKAMFMAILAILAVFSLISWLR